MKTISLILVIISMFGFFGDESSVEYYAEQYSVSRIRPTLEQKLQLKINEYDRVNSEIKVKLAEYKNRD